MAMRYVLSRLNLTRSMESTRGASRYFSSGKRTRLLIEEERAREIVFVRKLERDRLDKLKLKVEKETLKRKQAVLRREMEKGHSKVE